VIAEGKVLSHILDEYGGEAKNAMALLLMGKGGAMGLYLS
jgi:hypothetical protein